MPKATMGRRHYELLVRACREIEAGLAPLRGNDDMPVDDVMELIVARLAYACRQDNPSFDSFKFNAKARGKPE